LLQNDGFKLNKPVGANIKVFFICSMPKDGNKTRLKILDKTQVLVLENGYAGTTINQILEKTQLTKGAFFIILRVKPN
jgi:hypothetical protein